METILYSKYTDIRPFLKSGDFILVKGKGNLMGKVTKLWTKSPYFHAAIVFSIRVGEEVRWMVLEQHIGGQRIVSLSTYCDFDLFRLDIDFVKLSPHLIESTGKVPYAYGDFISIGLGESLRLKLPDFKGEVCSTLVARFLNLGGYSVDTQISPAGLYNRFKDKLVFKVRS